MIERTVDAGGIETFVRERPGAGTPVVFWHGVPNTSGMWTKFLERVSGPAYAADMPGFGCSARPDPARFDGSFDSLARWAGDVVEALGLKRYSVVVHDWGAIGLLAASRHAERIERLVAFNAVPFEHDYRWHWVAGVWRRRRLGEFFNAGAPRLRFASKLVFRQARPGFRAMPGPFIDDCLDPWDAGTSRAILALYRSADPALLGDRGSAIESLRAPSLVFWGTADPYLPVAFAPRLAARLGGAELVRCSDAGHWPWIDRPDLIDRAVDFLDQR